MRAIHYYREESRKKENPTCSVDESILDKQVAWNHTYSNRVEANVIDGLRLVSTETYKILIKTQNNRL